MTATLPSTGVSGGVFSSFVMASTHTTLVVVQMKLFLNRFFQRAFYSYFCAHLYIRMCALYRDPKQLKHSLYVLCCKTSGDAAWGKYWSAVVAMLRGELAKGIA
jgi:hypothetical protein